MYSDFETETLPGPISYQLVSEGEYATGYPQLETSHLVTLGLFTCKAISLYNPDSNFGVLAHLDGTTQLEKTLQPILELHEGDMSSSDIRIVQASVDQDTFLWPSSDSIADYFMRFNPRSLRIDRNHNQHPIRGVALDLSTGSVYDVRHDDSNMTRSQSNLIPSKPLRALHV